MEDLQAVPNFRRSQIDRILDRTRSNLKELYGEVVDDDELRMYIEDKIGRDRQEAIRESLAHLTPEDTVIAKLIVESNIKKAANEKFSVPNIVAIDEPKKQAPEVAKSNLPPLNVAPSQPSKKVEQRARR